MYDHIIVPFDGTIRSLGASNLGADLSSMLDAKLVVITASGVDTERGLWTLKARAMEMGTETAQVWVEPERKPAKAIANADHYRTNSLICMSTHARSGVRRMVFGSVAEDVLREIDTPVLLIGPDCDLQHAADIRQVILCLDGTPTSEAAVPLAGAWASAFGLRCLLLSVVDRAHATAPPDLDRFARTLEAICPVEALEIDGSDPLATILDTTKHATGSILVMATHGRVGFDRFAHGSMMADVVRQSSIPVLVQRGDASPGLEWLRQNAQQHAPDPSA